MLPLIIKPAMAALSAPLVEALVTGGMERAKAAALWSPGGEMYVSWARTLFLCRRSRAACLVCSVAI